jgi:hypothetical protein
MVENDVHQATQIIHSSETGFTYFMFLIMGDRQQSILLEANEKSTYCGVILQNLHYFLL